jgi:hypothetical protein
VAEQLRKENAELTTAIGNALTRTERGQAEIDRLRQERNEARKHEQGLVRSRQDLYDDLKRLEKERNEAQAEADRRVIQRNKLFDMVEKSEERVRVTENARKLAQGAYDSADKRASKLQANFDVLRDEYTAVCIELEAAREELEKKRAKKRAKRSPVTCVCGYPAPIIKQLDNGTWTVTCQGCSNSVARIGRRRSAIKHWNQAQERWAAEKEEEAEKPVACARCGRLPEITVEGRVWRAHCPCVALMKNAAWEISEANVIKAWNKKQEAMRDA